MARRRERADDDVLDEHDDGEEETRGLVSAQLGGSVQQNQAEREDLQREWFRRALKVTAVLAGVLFLVGLAHLGSGESAPTKGLPAAQASGSLQSSHDLTLIIRGDTSGGSSDSGADDYSAHDGSPDGDDDASQDAYADADAGADADADVDVDIIKNNRCPAGSKIIFIYPEVVNSGENTFEASFGDLDDLVNDPRYVEVSTAQRSAKHTFAILAQQRTYTSIASELGCAPGADGIASSCESTKPKTCVRWSFLLRDPVTRLVSAFNLVSASQTSPKSGRLLDGSAGVGNALFDCAPGSAAALLMQQEGTTVEDWANLDEGERNACSSSFNVFTRMLAPEVGDDPDAQLTLAKQRLAKMAWFGIYEKWTVSLQLLSFALHADVQHYVAASNPNERIDTLSAHAREVLEAHNAMDVNLYAFALDLLLRRGSKMRGAIHDPAYIPFKFSCDAEKVCWTHTPGQTTPTSFEQLKQGLLSYFPKSTAAAAASAAANASTAADVPDLCLAKQGCWREDLQERKSHIDEPKPPVDVKDGNVLEKARNFDTCLASVLVLGTRKGGTTSLFSYLSAHPRFYGVNLKGGPSDGELLFLEKLKLSKLTEPQSVRQSYNKAMVMSLNRFQSKATASGGKDIEHGLVDIMNGDALTGESSVGNGPSCLVPRFVASACGVHPRMRFVYLVRDPIERLISNHKMRKRLNPKRFPMTVEQYAVRDLHSMQKQIPSDADWFKKDKVPCLYKHDIGNSVWSGMYIVHLRRWLQYFPREQFLVIKSEDMFANPGLVLKRVLDFIDLDPSQIDIEQTVGKVYNSAPSNQKGKDAPLDITVETRAELQSFYATYNLALAETFGIDVSDWN
ncbi:Heparan-sulfate 6-O-sulfotransferase 3 [Hondaea fermentalgiana]|uniref:Heparan-sulfate 6-O-sulfotransferase 3 n=1 Tax=Hondaea fermentalgiana TaxID=2315210 RepID=A0A2R5GKW2_9STRA|nr:Heparan-sulfate 6-O-sulfotransferase 3 [Hondaea fermentalgiana]|eukprot:GBG31546.1 Heparan-sulfate 6-O-sulfotransferase 3 [Hondaea fermentalgiana]